MIASARLTSAVPLSREADQPPSPSLSRNVHFIENKSAPRRSFLLGSNQSISHPPASAYEAYIKTNQGLSAANGSPSIIKVCPLSNRRPAGLNNNAEHT